MVLKDYNHLSDDEFANLFIPIEKEEKEYAINMAENYVAYSIALHYKHNCLLSENVNYIIGGMMDMFNNVSIKEISIENINSILKDKYKLSIANYDPIEITEL